MSDDFPIDVPGDYVRGVNVVDIGDLRVARGYSRRPPMKCLHHNVAYDPQERRIWCRDCEKGIDPFDFLKTIIEKYNAVINTIHKREEMVKEAEDFQARNRAAKVMDQAWRKRNTVPCCPHCRQGILAEDVAGGVKTMDKDFAMKVNGNKKDRK